MTFQQRSQKAHNAGRKAFLNGGTLDDNPYNPNAYEYTDEGLCRRSWFNGWRFEWVLAKCPAGRWPSAANTAAAIAIREGLQPYRVMLHEEPGDKFQLVFDCFAEDADHAAEQAENAYPGCMVRNAFLFMED